MKPIYALLLLLLITSRCVHAQNWMERDISQRVALWLQVRDGNWAHGACAYNAEDLKTGVYKTTFTPINLPGCATDPAYRVVVNPEELVQPNKLVRTRYCSHSQSRQVILAVAIVTPTSIVMQAGEVTTTEGEPKIAVISGPIFTDSESDWGSSSITPLTRAQARLYYLDVEDVRPGRTTDTYSAFEAYSNALKAQVEIQLDSQNPDRFTILTHGRNARCIKSWDDAAEEE